MSEVDDSGSEFNVRKSTKKKTTARKTKKSDDNKEKKPRAPPVKITPEQIESLKNAYTKWREEINYKGSAIYDTDEQFDKQEYGLSKKGTAYGKLMQFIDKAFKCEHGNIDWNTAKVTKAAYERIMSSMPKITEMANNDAL